ncbi:hypothetical protein AHF37_00408 [Paragonimus kellicotti]|nr:hypothetical protein AHF37_00408 [Paragonimus kellicotti]
MAMSKPTPGYLIGIVIFCFLTVEVNALIPVECAQNVTRPGQVCCPHNPHNGLICGGPQRGFCQRIYAPKEDVPSVFWVDDRLAWPTRFIEHACQCQPRFFGVSCEQCWFGWTGPDCMEREHRIRRDIRKYSPHELEIFKDVVARSWNWPSRYVVLDESSNWNSDPVKKPRFIPASVQYYITFMHYYGSRSTLYKSRKECEEFAILDFNHDGVTFPTWHRYYNLIWERLLGEIAWKVHGVKDFSVPYWDWVGALQCDICTNKYIGAPGKIDRDGQRISIGSPFHNLTEFCWEQEPGATCTGCQSAGRFGKVTRRFRFENFPNQADIEFVLGLKNYFTDGERDNPDCVSFHMALEGFCGRPGSNSTGLWTHNKVHNMIEGSMATTITATNDPIFILHHSLIDKIFSMWYRLNKPRFTDYPNENVRPGHKRDAFMISIFPLARNGDMFTDVTALGYDYDDPKSVGDFAHNGGGPVFI